MLEVEGPEEAVPGGKEKYKVKKYHKQVKESEKSQVRWAVEVEGKEEALSERGGEVSIEIKQEWAGKEIAVMGYLNNPDPNICQKTKVVKWELPMLIIQSGGRKGKDAYKDKKSGRTYSLPNDAPDLLYNDYTKDDIGFSKLFEDLEKAAIENKKTPKEAKELAKKITDKIQELAKETDAEKIRKAFLNDAHWHLDGELKTNFYEMVNKTARIFKTPHPLEEFEFPILTKAVLGHENTKSFVKDVRMYTLENIAKENNDINKLKVLDAGNGKIYEDMLKNEVPILYFGGGYFDEDTTSGLTISIHTVWAYQVYMVEYGVKDNKPYGKLRFDFYDHFGLDCSDLIGISNKPKKDLFYRWFLLQHFLDYDYTPFITKISFDEDLNP